MTPIENLLIQSLKINSFSGQESDLAGFVIKKLPNFKIKKQFLSKNRFNVVARKGKSDIWLVCHMDVVRGEVPLKIFRDRIQGRGACDNKGNLAGLLVAANRLKNINILLTVGEEVDFAGIKKAAKVIKNGKFIVFEPTNFKIITEQRGVIIGTIKMEGKERHSSLGAKNSAIHNLIDKLYNLKRKKMPLLNIGVIEGGLAENIVAPSASAFFSIRPKTQSEFKNIIKVLKSKKFIISNTVSPFRSNFHDKIKSSGLVPFFTEMAFFRNSVLFGAGRIEQAHSDKEYILRKDLNRLPAKLIKLVGEINSIKI